MSANGMLAGLVAITAPCAFVNTVSAVIIGLVAGILVCWAVFFVERKLKVDDPVGAIAVHGFNGAWGLIALGLFADGTYGDGLEQCCRDSKRTLLWWRIAVHGSGYWCYRQLRLCFHPDVRVLQAAG